MSTAIALAASAQSAATAGGALTAQIVLSGAAYAQAVASGGLLTQIALAAGRAQCKLANDDRDPGHQKCSAGRAKVPPAMGNCDH